MDYIILYWEYVGDELKSFFEYQVTEEQAKKRYEELVLRNSVQSVHWLEVKLVKFVLK